MNVDLQNKTEIVDGKCYHPLNFKCTSIEIAHAPPDALFTFYWYINGEEIYISNTEYKRNIQKAYLTEINSFNKMGVKVLKLFCDTLALLS